ncbi:MAG TPA: response regulator [Candidatus Acidoferrales bacterium]|nr:response regulator [Candidatus Acidoferrales bacterium]
MPTRVLVVEDNATNLQLMLYLLKTFGYEASAAQDGLSGLSAADVGHFDLILCDVLMPGIDGYEFARRFKSGLRARPPLIAVTALAMVGDKERLIASGFDGYIAKPINPESFIGEIEAFLPAAFRSVKGKPEESSREAAATRNSGPVILAVDDTQVNLDLVRSSLEPFGYQVVEARNAAEGFEKALAFRPSLILCDLHMQDGDGFDLLRNVKTSKELVGVPFFFLSSTAWQTSEQIRGMQLGAQRFILRPIDPLDLRDVVATAIAADNGHHTGH